LDVSQPTISLRIRALEQEVGGALFLRQGSQLRLTELGQSFLPYAQTALRAMTTGAEVARRTLRGEKGQLRIATSPTLATGFFATTVARFHKSYPQIDVAIHTGHNRQILEMLYEHYVHLGFVTGPFFHPEISSLLRLEEPLVMVTHKAHPLTRGEPLTIAEVIKQSHPFFLIDWSWEVRHWQTQWLSSASSIIEVPPQTASTLISSGVGVGLLTHALALPGIKKGDLVELTVQDMPRLQRESVLVYRTVDSPRPSAINEWLRFLQEEAREYCLA
jgi:DNA-binding transcriptional LysR family regulator